MTHASAQEGRFVATVVGAWDGLRVARGKLAAGEATAGQLVANLLTLDVRGHGWREYRLAWSRA